MSDEAKRLELFRKLPLRAQRAFIAATKDNPVLAADTNYVENLERIHEECLMNATPEERARLGGF
jgi:hypothetical protein